MENGLHDPTAYFFSEELGGPIHSKIDDLTHLVPTKHEHNGLLVANFGLRRPQNVPRPCSGQAKY